MYEHLPARLEGVGKRYGSIEALRDVRLSVGAGETLALLGPNGAGKTTAVRTLLGLIAPTSGTVRVFGADPMQARTRTRVGAMLQVSGVPSTLTVAELVTLFSSYYPHPLPVAETIRLAGLNGFERRRAGALSGGEQQRLFFALAICGDPDLLVLDEPTVGLDVEARTVIWERITALAGDGRSVILTTHYLAEAQALCERVAVVSKGRIIADGSVRDLTGSLGGSTVRVRTALDTATLRGLPAVSHVATGAAETELVTQEPDALVRALYTADPSCTILAIARADLEAAYLAITGSAKEASLA